MSRNLEKGFSLVELMVTLSILAFVLAIGVPSFSTYIANSSLRAAATSVYGGLQKARAEAIRTNLDVQFLLTDAEPSAGNVNGLAASPTGRNWAVRVPVRPLTVPPTFELLDSRLGSEGRGSNVVVNSGGMGIITFTGVGATRSAAASTIAFTHATLNPTCDLDHGLRCTNVLVSVAGQTRLCEPGRPNTDPRSCQ